MHRDRHPIRDVLLIAMLTVFGASSAPCMLASGNTPAQTEAAIQADYEANIAAAFNEHLKFFNDQMHRRLAKDKNGNSDTYVLYDVQMHMQNAAIYADYRGNKQMLAQLMALCLIPFESEYLTDGKWLNNRYGLVGVEVDLCIAQYFSLLTRILSACQRHGLDPHFSKDNLRIVNDHLNRWLAQKVNRDRVDDRHLFFVQSVLQLYDYVNNSDHTSDNFAARKQYVKDYMAKSVRPKWEVVKQTHQGRQYDCWMLDRTGWVDHSNYQFAGYGSEITKTNSDTDSQSMFRADGTIKQPPKGISKVATDVSHARRFNWFFETVKHFGKPFDVTINDEALQGWADNLALRVSRGTLEDPHFTVFSDGVDGWYRVGYRGRKSFGYTLGDMDLHFVASSYGIFGVYNPRIHQWMRAWVIKHPTAIDGYHGGYALSYYTSLATDIRKPLARGKR